MRALLVLGLLTGSFMTAAIACADATPIGRLPKGSTATVVAPRGSLVAVALPRQLESTGLEWRLARRVDLLRRFAPRFRDGAPSSGAPTLQRQLPGSQTPPGTWVAQRLVHGGRSRRASVGQTYLDGAANAFVNSA